MLERFAANKGNLAKDWDAEARVVERAELKKTLDQIGIARFMSRVAAGIIPASLGREVMDDHFRDAEKRPFIAHVAKAIFDT